MSAPDGGGGGVRLQGGRKRDVLKEEASALFETDDFFVNADERIAACSQGGVGVHAVDALVASLVHAENADTLPAFASGGSRARYLETTGASGSQVTEDALFEKDLHEPLLAQAAADVPQPATKSTHDAPRRARADHLDDLDDLDDDDDELASIREFAAHVRVEDLVPESRTTRRSPADMQPAELENRTAARRNGDDDDDDDDDGVGGVDEDGRVREGVTSAMEEARRRRRERRRPPQPPPTK